MVESSPPAGKSYKTFFLKS